MSTFFPGLTKTTYIFLGISIFIATADAFFVTLNYYSSRRALLDTLCEQGGDMRTAFELVLSSTEAGMLSNATLIASDPTTNELFLQGKRAVEMEGGGAGGKRAQAIRKALLDHVQSGWEQLEKQFSVRQLHFHLSPGSLSFLRVHRPERYGDRMDSIRHTVVDSNRTLEPTVGFETGRVYSGIRGVVPVFAREPETEQRIHVGALEAGTSFEHLMQVFIKKYPVRAAILLDEEHVKGIVWPDLLKGKIVDLADKGRYYLEYSSAPELASLLRSADIDSPDFSGSRLIEISGKPFGITSFPLRDYAGDRDAERKDVGRVVFIRDARKQVAGLWNELHQNILYAIAAFVLLEVILYVGIHAVTNGLKKEIRERTREGVEANRKASEQWEARQRALLKQRRSEAKLEAILENSPAVISVKDTAGCYQQVNRRFEELFDLDRGQVIGKTDFDLFPLDIARRIQGADLPTLEDGETGEIDEHYPTKQGDKIYLTVKSPLYDASNKIDGVVTVSTDITDRRAAEEKRLRYVQAQRDTLVREVHHRIKNHLQGISGLLAAHAAATGARCVSCPPITSAIGQIQSISQVHGLQGCNKSEAVDLHALVVSTCNHMRSIHGCKIEIESETLNGGSVTIVSDEAVPVALVFNELLQNAVKHTPKAERHHPIAVKLQRRSGGILVRIKNNGGPLPASFDLELGKGLGAGLELLKALLPPKGATVSFRSDMHSVVAEFALSSPVVPVERAAIRINDCCLTA